MISMMKTRLGALRCPVAAGVGSGADGAFGGAVAVSWFDQRAQRVFSTAHIVNLIPLSTADNSTGVSAPPERSP